MKSEKKETSFLYDLKELFVFASVYVVFIGWMYKYYFVHSFGISSRDIDLSTSDLMIYSFSVFANHWVLMSIALLLIFSVSYKNIISNAYLKVAIIIACFPLFWWLALDTAINSANDIKAKPECYLSRLFLVYNKDFVKLNDSINNYSQDASRRQILDLQNNQNLYLLFNNPNGYYIFEKNNLITIYYIRKEIVDISVFSQKK